MNKNTIKHYLFHIRNTLSNSMYIHRTTALLLAIILFGIMQYGIAATIQVSGSCTLVNAITAAENDAVTEGCTAGSGADTILLPSGSTHTLLSVNNTQGFDAPNGLPLIESTIIIEGNNSTIIRPASAPTFRLITIRPEGDLTLKNVTLSGGYIDKSDGGAISNRAGILTLIDSSITDSFANQVGGAIANSGGTITIIRSTLANNTANNAGGAIHNFSRGTLSIEDSTLSNNQTLRNDLGGGGGLYIGGNPTTLTNVTMVNNAAGFEGGGILHVTGALNIGQSLIAGNTAPNAPNIFFNTAASNASVSVNSYNLFGADGSAGIVGFTSGSTDIVPGISLDAILETVLNDNGGSTATHALVTDSPAIDAVPDTADGCQGIDQRGFARPQGIGCDIGAFEVESIIDEEPPEISFTFTPTFPLVGEEVTFTAESTGNEQGLQWFWDFDDGKTAEGKIVTHRFVEEKTFSVDLELLDSNMNFLAAFAAPVDVVCEIGKTSPTPKDCDGDALLNEWETEGWGIDFDKDDDVIDLDLHAMGANPLHKDIFVEVDYMKNTRHSHKPDPKAMHYVIQAFSDSPINNPDGKEGIVLHIDYGEDSIMNPLTGETWGSKFSESNELQHLDYLAKDNLDEMWDKFDKIKKFFEGRKPVFHYVISVHDLVNDNANLGESRGIKSSEFIISDGKSNRDKDKKENFIIKEAVIFMHELGHNLGLYHGGNEDINNKPNYISLMNYTYAHSLWENGGFGRFDYSHFVLPTLSVLPTLNEKMLNEADGIKLGKTNNYGSIHYCPDKTLRLSKDIRKPIDWNCNNSIDKDLVEVNINNDSKYSKLKSYNDWQNIVFNGGGVIGKLNNSVASLKGYPEPPGWFDNAEEIEAMMEYKVIVSRPLFHNIYIGEKTTYSFTIENRGQQDDTYNVEISSKLGWAEIDKLPKQISVKSHDEVTVNVTVVVPNTAVIGDSDELGFYVESQANTRMADSVYVETIVVSFDERHSDDDYILDNIDQCPKTVIRTPVIINKCDTEVKDHVDAVGCSINDKVKHCTSEAKNHGKFVSCVASFANNLRQERVISFLEKASILKCAAKANIRKKLYKLDSRNFHTSDSHTNH